MKKRTVIIAVALIAVGLAIFMVALIGAGFDWSRFSTVQYETNTYAVEEAFDKIDVQTDTADVTFAPSGNDHCVVICQEQSNVKHSVTVEEGTLKIATVDERMWLDYISVYSQSLSVTVYLPQSAYAALAVKSDTGNVTVPAAFSFGSVDVTTSTGNTVCEASVSGALKIAASTGDIRLHGVNVGSAELSVSTGKINVASVTCSGDFSVTVSTGKTVLTDVTCQNFTSTGDTGDITLKNVTASALCTIRRDTGDVRFENSDAGEITVTTSTGNVTGTLRTGKIFTVSTSTGRVRVPESTVGGTCRITTNTGNVELTLAAS